MGNLREIPDGAGQSGYFSDLILTKWTAFIPDNVPRLFTQAHIL
jgi:hypothetical protein